MIGGKRNKNLMKENSRYWWGEESGQEREVKGKEKESKFSLVKKNTKKYRKLEQKAAEDDRSKAQQELNERN